MPLISQNEYHYAYACALACAKTIPIFLFEKCRTNKKYTPALYTLGICAIIDACFMLAYFMCVNWDNFGISYENANYVIDLTYNAHASGFFNWHDLYIAIELAVLIRICFDFNYRSCAFWINRIYNDIISKHNTIR